MQVLEGHLDAQGLRFAIVVSRFNEALTARLESGAVDCLQRHGAEDDQITIVRVPGAWEIPLIADNTICTPALQLPTTLGADIVVHSTTKYICGNASSLGGIICGSREVVEGIREGCMRYLGPAMSPFTAWLNLNGLETLVSRYQVQAVRAAYLILYDRSLAEDVVQAAFVKAAQRIHQFNDGRPFGPWFSRIVVNDALKLTKKQERSVSLDEHLDDSTVRLAKWLADPDPNPEQLVEQKETRQVILKAIQSLLSFNWRWLIRMVTLFLSRYMSASSWILKANR